MILPTVRCSFTAVIILSLVFAVSCEPKRFTETSNGSSITFRGVVTYSAGHILFLQSKTVAIKIDGIATSNLPQLKTLVEAKGVLLLTSGVPTLTHTTLSPIGLADPADLYAARASDLTKRAIEGRFVELKGRAQSAGMDQDGLLRVRIRDGDNIITAHITENADIDRDALPGAVVTLKGVADPVVNGEGKVEEYRVWTALSNYLTVVESAAPRWNIPVSSVNQVRTTTAVNSSRSSPRVRLRGGVIDDARRGLLFQDATGALPIKMGQSLLPFTGKDLWVWAFPEGSKGIFNSKTPKCKMRLSRTCPLQAFRLDG